MLRVCLHVKCWWMITIVICTDLPVAGHLLSKGSLWGVVLDLEHERVTLALQAVPASSEGLEELTLLHGIVAVVPHVQYLQSAGRACRRSRGTAQSMFMQR